MPGSLHQPELTTSTTNTALLLQTSPIAQLGGVSFEWWTTLVHATMIDPTTLHNQRSPMCLKRDGRWDVIPVTQSLPLHYMESRKRCLYLKSEWNDELSWMKWFFTVPLNNSNILCKNDRPGCTTLQACCSLLIRGCKSCLVQHFLCSQPAIRLLQFIQGQAQGWVPSVNLNAQKCQSCCWSLQLLHLATGISNLSKTTNKILKYSSHWLELGAPMMKKSSR